MSQITQQKTPYGVLAAQDRGLRLPLEVLKSRAGFYIGTSTQEGPYSRESVEYWQAESEAWSALKNQTWTQRLHP